MISYTSNMGILANKRILLGVTGGIAAYKSAELTRQLRAEGAEVKVVMTPAAQAFITPLTLQALSDNPVHVELLDHESEAAMSHIALARWADRIVAAPASANFIARLSHGLADDLLSTLCLASAAPLLLAPAMNQQMWLNSATQENVRRLQARGAVLLGPVAGSQACGETGPGRMAEPEEIVRALGDSFSSGQLAGLRVLVTAGPTREFIDPVRYLSNCSSGKMGYAIAQAAVEAGAEALLVSGPVALAPPERVQLVEVVSAEQMRDAVLAALASFDIFISAAAVADYRSVDTATRKLKKRAARPRLQLEKTPDILLEAASLKESPFTVGFAAETENLAANAKQKLADKKLDMIAANQVGDGFGFDSEFNALEVHWRGGSQRLELAAKEKLARQLVELIAARHRKKTAPKPRRAAAKTTAN